MGTWCPTPDSVPAAVDDKATDRAKAWQRLAAAQISARKTELLAQMEQALEEDLRQAATTEIRDVRGKLAVVVRRVSQTLIMRMLKQYAVDEATAALEGRPHEPLFEIPSALQEALPQRLTACGGQRRLLVLAPKQLAPLVAAQIPGNSELPVPTVLADADSDMLVSYEVEDQPLSLLAEKVLGQRYQAVEAAARCTRGRTCPGRRCKLAQFHRQFLPGVDRDLVAELDRRPTVRHNQPRFDRLAGQSSRLLSSV